MRTHYYEKPRAVEIEIDADGWPHVIVWTAEGTVERVRVRPQGHAEVEVMNTGEGYDGAYSAESSRKARERSGERTKP
jgi:hypothetical protein